MSRIFDTSANLVGVTPIEPLQTGPNDQEHNHVNDGTQGLTVTELPGPSAVKSDNR